MKHNKVPYSVILDATQGHPEAMRTVLRHYERYILHYATRTYYDRFGIAHSFLDEDIRQNIEAALMLSIIYRFDPCRLPAGERLEDKE